jgi:serine/threonine-protein kinase
MLRAGERLGPYEVVSPLGAGGMGEVYRARDTRLGRDVAVKVLPQGLVLEHDRVRRFEQEARAASALNHPNILTILDVGTYRESPYLVSELLEGESLRDHLARGPLPLARGIEYGVQLAQGLAAAHEKGIVHRDLKPGNVFLTRDGIVKILDFGVAKLTREPTVLGDADTATTAGAETGSGVVLGTVGYMAPEQVRGAPCDHRADVFAYGCVLYEMLCGRRAFRGDSDADTISAILHDDPPPLTEVNPRLPPALDGIVGRCLEKRPEDRFESVRDAGFALRTVTTTGSPRRVPRARRSIAVRIPAWVAAGALLLLGAWGAAALVRRWLAEPPLPRAIHLAVAGFESADRAAGPAAFAEGLTGVIATGLMRLEHSAPGSFWVVPRSEAAKLGATSVQDLGRTFNATVVVTGRLARSGDRLRLELAARRPASAAVLRTLVVEDSVSNVASFQVEAVAHLAEALGLGPTPAARQRLVAAATTMTGAFEAYVEGCGRLGSAKTKADLDAATALLEKAVASDPLFASGWVALARVALARFEATRDQSWIGTGLEHVDRSLRLGAADAAPWRVAASLHRAAGRPAEAVEALERGVRTAPDDSEALLDLAEAYQAAGRFAEAEASIRRVVYLRPGYWVGHDRLAKLYLARGMNEAAATEFQHVVDSAPEFSLAYVKLGSVFCFLERTEDGRRMFERSIEIEPTYHGLSNLAALHFNAARYADAAAMFERAIEVDDSDYSLWGNLAYSYRFGPSPEKAEAAFRKAVQMGEAVLADDPGDQAVRIDLAGYHAMLGENARGRQVLEPVVAAAPTVPQTAANLAETLWDVGDHERAIEWVERAFDAGVPRSRFEGRPTLRDMIADERYRALVGRQGGGAERARPDSTEGRRP